MWICERCVKCTGCTPQLIKNTFEYKLLVQRYHEDNQALRTYCGSRRSLRSRPSRDRRGPSRRSSGRPPPRWRPDSGPNRAGGGSDRSGPPGTLS